MRHKGKTFTWNNAAEESFQRIKKELCEAPVLGMPTEKGMYVLDTDASVVAISGILHQEQEWNGKTVLRPIAYGSKVLIDTEMKYGAPKAEMFAVVTFVEKYRAYLGSEPFKLRVDNRALSWLKTYSRDQSYIRRRIVCLDGYNMIIEHRTKDKHQNDDNLSKKTKFYERQERVEADRPEIKDGFSFMDKETYDSLPLTRWLDKSGKPIEDHPELPKEPPEKTILKKTRGMPIGMMLKSKIVRETLVHDQQHSKELKGVICHPTLTEGRLFHTRTRNRSGAERDREEGERKLEWMRDVKSKGDEGQSIQQVDLSAEQHLKTEDPLFGWTATDRPLEIPPDNLDPASSTGTSINIFVRGVAVGLTHTKNLMIKILREVRETSGLELGEEEAELTIGRNFKRNLKFPMNTRRTS